MATRGHGVLSLYENDETEVPQAWDKTATLARQIYENASVFLRSRLDVNFIPIWILTQTRLFHGLFHVG